jgi:hypothetical protein
MRWPGGVGALEGGFRFDLEVAREVGQDKEHVTHLRPHPFVGRGFALDELLLELRHLLVHLDHDIRRLSPVESDRRRFLGHSIGLQQRRQGVWNTVEH